jgi:hypothetical protein
MFTGFASENTPAIQVWDFFSTFASTTAVRSVSLADDCAPIQYFRTGATTTAIRVYLPSSAIEGKQIKIINSTYGINFQSISIYSSDANAGGSTNAIASAGAGQTLDFCYSKNFISLGAGGGNIATGWITLNQAPISSANYASVILGGLSNSAGGAYSSVISGQGNSANNNFASVVGGQSNTASGLNSAVVDGSSNTASGTNAFVGGGSSNTASGGNSFVGSGNVNLANGSNSAVVNGSWGTTRSIEGMQASPACNTPIAGLRGASQSALLVLGVETTDATATKLRSNTSAATTTNQVILPNNSAYVFQGTCIANVTGGSTTSGWKYEGVIKRGANAASTTLVAAVTPTVIAQDALATTWVLAITADTTNGGIAVTVTGAAATTIRWVSTIETTEVTF